MLLVIVRLVFAFAIGGAALTGQPIWAAVAIIPGAILFFTDGGWQPLLVYGLGGILLFGLFNIIF